MANPFHTPQHKQVAAPSRDFRFSDFGSVCLLTPLTDAARDWCDEHIAADAQRWCGAFAIETRYGPALIDGINEAGLTGEVV